MAFGTAKSRGRRERPYQNIIEWAIWLLKSPTWQNVAAALKTGYGKFYSNWETLLPLELQREVGDDEQEEAPRTVLCYARESMYETTRSIEDIASRSTMNHKAIVAVEEIKGTTDGFVGFLPRIYMEMSEKIALINSEELPEHTPDIIFRDIKVRAAQDLLLGLTQCCYYYSWKQRFTEE
jgi:hypothetical protein